MFSLTLNHHKHHFCYFVIIIFCQNINTNWWQRLKVLFSTKQSPWNIYTRHKVQLTSRNNAISGANLTARQEEVEPFQFQFTSRHQAPGGCPLQTLAQHNQPTERIALILNNGLFCPRLSSFLRVQQDFTISHLASSLPWPVNMLLFYFVKFCLDAAQLQLSPLLLQPNWWW